MCRLSLSLHAPFVPTASPYLLRRQRRRRGRGAGRGSRPPCRAAPPRASHPVPAAPARRPRAGRGAAAACVTRGQAADGRDRSPASSVTVCSTCTSYTIDSRSRTLCTRRRYCLLRSHALSSIVVLRPCGWVSLRLWNAGGLTCPHCLRRPSYASARALKQHDRRASLSLSYSVCSDRRCP